MKTILIETVSNGWIVRPFQPSSNWACTELPCMAVYNDLAALQKDLPSLLGFKDYANAAPEPKEFVNVEPESPF